MAVDVQLKTKPKAWFLDTPDAMQEAQRELIGEGYRSTVQVWPDVDGEPLWQFEANDSRPDTKHTVVAVLGQYLLLSGGLLQAMTGDEYTTLTK